MQALAAAAPPRSLSRAVPCPLGRCQTKPKKLTLLKLRPSCNQAPCQGHGKEASSTASLYTVCAPPPYRATAAVPSQEKRKGHRVVRRRSVRARLPRLVGSQQECNRGGGRRRHISHLQEKGRGKKGEMMKSDSWSCTGQRAACVPVCRLGAGFGERDGVLRRVT